MWIVTADTDPKLEPTGPHLPNRGDLPGNENRMAQGQQVDTDMHLWDPAHTQKRRGTDEAVIPLPPVETDVVASGDM